MSRITKRFSSFFIITLLIIIAVGGTRDLRSENVFLKDGRIVNGAIVNDAAQSVTVKKADGKSEVITRGNILRILYTNLKMGKIHVQMRDGGNFEAFVVDEDQDTYTFRKVLLSPDETKVNRSDILFISERNPSGLKGTPDTTSVSLSWFPPYNPVKHYRVYHREKSEGDFRPAIISRGKNFTLENLKSNTAYIVKVTAVDNSDDESSPSNMLTVTTKNILPGRPRVLSTVRGSSGGARTLRVEWAPSVDPDGKVEKYRIYALQGKESKILGDTREETYTVNGDALSDRIYLCAVDDRGDESERSRLYFNEMRVALYPGAVLPLGDLGKKTELGYGAVAAFTLNSNFLRGLILGAEAGYFTLKGNDDLQSDYTKTRSARMANLFVTAGYRLNVSYKFSVTPYAGAGAAYFSAEYTERDKVLFFERDRTVSEYGPAACAGVEAGYRLTESFSVVLKASGGYLVGTDAGFFAGIALGCMYGL